jgi:D-aspartate ligase
VDQLRLEDSSTPAVVLGCFWHGGLGIVRSLGRLGVPVYAVDADRYTPAFFSKYCREKLLWDVYAAPAEDTVRFLRQLGDRIGHRAVLFPTSDVAAMLVLDRAAELEDRFVFPRPDPALVHSLCSKREMYHLARMHGVPAPETAFPQSRADVLAYLDVARFPVLLKPIYSVRPGRPLQSMEIVRSARQLLDRYDAIEDPAEPNLMLQEYIPGPDQATWTFNGYFDRRAESLVSFTGRKLRNHAPYFGQCCLGVCQQNDAVEQQTIRFMHAIGYQGALDLGHRYDARDGLYKINDVNPRVGAMFRVFVGDNGIDVARALYQDMTGQAVVASRAREGRKWIREDGDLKSSIRYWRDGNLTLREWRQSLKGIAEGVFLDRDDPMPGLCVFGLRPAHKAWRGLRGAFGTAAGQPRVVGGAVKRAP